MTKLKLSLGLQRLITTPTLFVLATVFCNQQTIAIKLKCTNIDEFYYASPGSHCTGFYRCTSREKFESDECGPGSMFDFYKQSCTRSAGICYEPTCTGRTNGIYQDTTHACRRSYTCHSGRVINIDNCPPNHLHNGINCVSQELVTCDLPHTTAIGYPFEGDQRCSDKQDGSYGVKDCSTYIVCSNHEVADEKSCSLGYRFKNDIRQCVLANQVPSCSNEIENSNSMCKNKKDGLNFDSTSIDCTTYIVCQSEKFIKREKCSNQAVFNGEECVPTPLYTCPRAIWNTENDICKAHGNGFYMNPQQGCSSYVRCMRGRTVEVFDCPTGQYFDPDEKNCVFEKFEERKKCVNPKKSNYCNNKAQGFYQDHECAHYYYCINGMKTEYKCPSNKIFNGENCVNKGRYTCPLDDDDTCANRSDGYYKDKNGGCRGYFYCSNGHKISYICEEGHYFDGNQCKKNTDIAKCKSDLSCKSKSDGYHPDLKSNCRNYVYCLNQEKVTQLTCRGDKIFNGAKCVDSKEFACPSLQNHQQINCKPRLCTEMNCQRDGFYPDIDSGCKNYYFCIGGKKSSLSCSAGQIFNGELCVSEDKFTCPVYCNYNPQQGDDIKNCPLSGF
ncbi:neurogenic locus notch homolog protein 1-like [Condylostylus longicornis]|uniref:neurogenic locus notch homolog protein 1-like n=1 Tax=Condylostylus longicornis TaxID=2530218 RepID=UPI00244DFA95|nr:neurogenic locus notch homolog protein 1-like [Condylostylus longicornis]